MIINSYIFGPSIDPDAQAFITAASITDPTQQSAINNLVVSLKGYSIWTKMKAIYPFVGGTASSHKFNLKDPRDLDAAFRLVFNGGWTHNSNGATPNGTNGYADTKLNDNSVMTLNNAHMSYYSRTNVNTTQIELGAGVGSNILEIRTSGVTYVRVHGADLSQFNDSDSRAFYIANRTSATNLNSWKNGIKQNTNTNSGTRSKANVNYFLGAANDGGVANYFSSKETAFASIGDGLTDTEAANLYTAVQAFQVTLGRSIGTQTVSDADAQAFVTNAGIVDQVEANAINNLVIGLKADGLWTKMKALYPMVGGSNTSTSYNLRNTAQYQISWAGGVTSSANGVTFGVNGYGNTGLNPTTDLTLNDTHLSFYSRTDGSGGIDIGATATSDFQNFFIAQQYFGNFYADSYSSASRFQLTVQTKGLMTITRTASNSFKAFKNATQIGTTITSSSGSLPNWNIFLGATNRDGATNPTAYSARNQAFASIGTGLTDTDVTNLNTRVTTFQTALNRNV